jgi:hypothetical protein
MLVNIAMLVLGTQTPPPDNTGFFTLDDYLYLNDMFGFTNCIKSPDKRLLSPAA